MISKPKICWLNGRNEGRSKSVFRQLCINTLWQSKGYLLNIKMDLLDTLHVVRYWSENLCSTIMTHLCNLQVKVIDFEIFLMFKVNIFG